MSGSVGAEVHEELVKLGPPRPAHPGKVRWFKNQLRRQCSYRALHMAGCLPPVAMAPWPMAHAAFVQMGIMAP